MKLTFASYLRFLGIICPGGPNWLGTICPRGPNFWGPFVHGDRIGLDRLSRGTNQLGTNCGGPNVRGPYAFGTKCVTAFKLLWYIISFIHTFSFIHLAARKPFQIKFRTDQNEVDVASSATVINDETNGTPKGYIGFSLDFFQQSC